MCRALRGGEATHIEGTQARVLSTRRRRPEARDRTGGNGPAERKHERRTGGIQPDIAGGRREEYITPGFGGLKLRRAEHEIHSRFIWGWRGAPALINLQPNSQQSNHSGARHSECRAGQSRYVKSALADLATRSPRRPISLYENCVSSSIYVKSAQPKL